MIGQKGIPAVQGGVERHVHDLSVRLSEHGHKVVVYARTWYTGAKGTDTVQGITRVHVPTIRTKHLDTITHVFVSTVHALFGGYDIIHYHGVGPALLAWIPRIFAPKTKVIITFHSIDRFHKKWNWFAKLMLRLGERAACVYAHDTIAVSRGIAKYTRETYEYETTYIPNGVELPEKNIDDAHLASFGLTKNTYIVMISRLVPHKGAHVLIEAFKQLKNQNIENKEIQVLKLVIVGGAAYTDEYVRELHLAAGSVNDIVFTDFQSGEVLDQLYHHARVMVHPSLNEGLPITVLQGMSHGLPVLVSGIPEHREVVTDERMLFHENDVRSLTTVLENFMKLEKEECKKIGKQNYARIQERYDWEHVVGEVESVYRNTLHTRDATIKSVSV